MSVEARSSILTGRTLPAILRQASRRSVSARTTGAPSIRPLLNTIWREWWREDHPFWLSAHRPLSPVRGPCPSQSPQPRARPVRREQCPLVGMGLNHRKAGEPGGPEMRGRATRVLRSGGRGPAASLLRRCSGAVQAGELGASGEQEGDRRGGARRASGGRSRGGTRSARTKRRSRSSVRRYVRRGRGV